MHFPDRIYGLEFEYGAMNQDSYGVFSETKELQPLSLIAKPICGSLFSLPRPRQWHSNGSSSYVDTGNHPEHATTECLSVRDAVIYAKAGDILMNQIFARTFTSGETIHLFKNNLSFDANKRGYFSFGCHENYHMANKFLFMTPLIPLLITRQILDGAGWWHRRGDSDEVCYALSQRALIMEREKNSLTLYDRGILNDKETTDTGPAGRFHLILGDSNILEFAMYLKLGTVSLVLALIEGKKVPAVPCLDPILTLKNIALNGDPLEQCVGDPSQNYAQSPFEVQTIYLEAARKELKEGTFDSEETETELKHIALCWEQALNAIYNHDIKWMLGRIDHVTKKYLVDREIARRNITDASDAFSFRKDLDIFYHDITHGVWQKRMETTWADRRIVTDREIEHALTNAPRRTRAALRSQFIKTVIEHDLVNHIRMDWSYCHASNMKTIFDLPDPFCYESDDFNAFLLSFPALCNAPSAANVTASDNNDITVPNYA